MRTNSPNNNDSGEDLRNNKVAAWVHAEVFVVLKRGALDIAVEALVIGLRLGR